MLTEGQGLEGPVSCLSLLRILQELSDKEVGMWAVLEGLDRAFLNGQPPILASLNSDVPFPPSTPGGHLEHRII